MIHSYYLMGVITVVFLGSLTWESDKQEYIQEDSEYVCGGGINQKKN